MIFNVPQFIEVEDKIVGPLTFKQFVYVLGGAGAVFIIYKFLGLWLGIWLIIPIVVLSLALAFYKVNKRPFVVILESAIKYWLGGKLYVWRKIPKKKVAEEKKKEDEAQNPNELPNIPRISKSKLEDIAWSLDVKENIK